MLGSTFNSEAYCSCVNVLGVVRYLLLLTVTNSDLQRTCQLGKVDLGQFVTGSKFLYFWLPSGFVAFIWMRLRVLEQEGGIEVKH